MSSLGWVHTACALAALASGCAVLVRRKGTRSHRRLGWVYVVSLVAMNATALMIYRLSGGFGPFHAAALLSLATVGVGVLSVVRRQPADRWVEYHYYWMTYSYAGLVAAAGAELATRVRGATFWWTVVLASAAVLAAGAALISRRARITLAPFRRPPEPHAPGPVG